MKASTMNEVKHTTLLLTLNKVTWKREVSLPVRKQFSHCPNCNQQFSALSTEHCGFPGSVDTNWGWVFIIGLGSSFTLSGSFTLVPFSFLLDESYISATYPFLPASGLWFFFIALLSVYVHRDLFNQVRMVIRKLKNDKVSRRSIYQGSLKVGHFGRGSGQGKSMKTWRVDQSMYRPYRKYLIKTIWHPWQRHMTSGFPN